MASRHFSRMIVLQSLYEWEMWKNEKDINEIIDRNIANLAQDLTDKDFPRNLVLGIIKNQEALDDIITKSAPERPLEQINSVDRNVLRLGLYELLFENTKDVPPKVAINEAVELAKNFGSDNSYSFINGVLGTIYKTIKEVSPEEEEEEATKQDEAEIVAENINEPINK